MNKLAKQSTAKLGRLTDKMYNLFVPIPLFSASSIAILVLTILSSSVRAESSCKPPQSDEYLLLIVTRTPEQQERAKRSFPGNTDNTVCRYVNETVTRVGGFRSSEIASDWVKYIKDVVGLQAYVVRSPAAALPQNLPVYNPEPATGSEPIANPQTGNIGFNPQALGPGYAVLVDYFNQPELAAQVKQALGTQVGLASYGQRPFLFVAYTTDQNAATAAVKTLSDRGFWPMLVDSRRVTVISPAVR
ncbi:hypothetical protein IQ270_22190 [Microcoleus sp. LEGE 07076]|uniref:hypothetical protein n=1 Tax=Microcoleus sp. LEGE 07076 TaxID=915322 RepID=UPI0018818C0D|nr:hypothetical protein [Microcoleus sp. LEGE 07076]MBE9187288.1 hypothetical protein [Microcoleus sp. LEGE 07076]